MNRSILLAALFAACAATCIGAGAENGGAAAAKADRNERMMKITGGRVVKPGTQRGEIACVDCQKSAQRAWLEESVAYFAKCSRFKVTLSEGAFDVLKPQVRGSLSIFVVDDANLPALLAAPDDRWALVNVARLRSDKEPFFKARVQKELSRAFSILCGAFTSTFPQSLPGAIARAEDLDAYVDPSIPMDVISRFPKYARAFGVTPAVVTSYRNACKQGWAPAPTNDVQKAIWNEMRQIPTKPIKIEFDKAKGR